MNYDDVLILIERMSKEQQEAGQRAVFSNRNNNTVYKKLENYLNNKWYIGKESPNTVSPLSKKKLKQKLDEYKRLEEVRRIIKWKSNLPILNKNSKEGKENKEIRKYVYNILGKKPEWEIKKKDNNFESSNVMKHSVLFLNDKVDDKNFILKDKKIRNIFEKYNIEHEYGHMYEWLKRYIETGIIEPLVGTASYNKVEASNDEGDADKYAYGNLNRKDRWGLLKNYKFTSKDLEDKAKEFKNISIESIVNDYKIGKITKEEATNKIKEYFKTLYLTGANNRAVNMKKTLLSIEKEKKANEKIR